MTQAEKILSPPRATVQLVVNPIKPHDFMITVTDEIAMTISMLECVYLAIGNEDVEESKEAVQSVIWNIQKSLKSLNEQITAHVRSDFKIHVAA